MPGSSEKETLAQVRQYAEHLVACASSYGPTENLNTAQRYTRDQMQADGDVLLGILNGEEWSLGRATL